MKCQTTAREQALKITRCYSQVNERGFSDHTRLLLGNLGLLSTQPLLPYSLTPRPGEELQAPSACQPFNSSSESCVCNMGCFQRIGISYTP